MESLQFEPLRRLLCKVKVSQADVARPEEVILFQSVVVPHGDLQSALPHRLQRYVVDELQHKQQKRHQDVV